MMNSNYKQRDGFWKPTNDIITALEKGDKALKEYYKNVSKEHEESSRIGVVLDWEAKVRSFESVLR